MAKPQLPKLKLWVRFPSSAPGKSLAISTVAGLFSTFFKRRGFAVFYRVLLPVQARNQARYGVDLSGFELFPTSQNRHEYRFWTLEQCLSVP